MLQARLRGVVFTLALLSCGAGLQAEVPEAGAAASAPPLPSVMGVGLTSAQLDRSLRFYRDGLGMVELRRIPQGAVVEVIMGFDSQGAGVTIFLLGPSSGAGPAVKPASHDKLVLSVPDAEALAARLASAGFKPGPIKSLPEYRIKNFMVSDPDGHVLEIVQKDARQTREGG